MLLYICIISSELELLQHVIQASIMCVHIIYVVYVCTYNSTTVQLINERLLIEATVYITQQNGKSIILHVVTNTISHIKKKIEKEEKIPYDLQVLVYGGEKLEENKSLDDYSVDGFDELELIQSGQFYCSLWWPRRVTCHGGCL